VYAHYLFSEKEQKAIHERFNDAKQFLMNVVSLDPRCAQVWANTMMALMEKLYYIHHHHKLFKYSLVHQLSQHLYYKY
jgi:hypothetical protein